MHSTSLLPLRAQSYFVSWIHFKHDEHQDRLRLNIEILLQAFYHCWSSRWKLRTATCGETHVWPKSSRKKARTHRISWVHTPNENYLQSNLCNRMRVQTPDFPRTMFFFSSSLALNRLLAQLCLTRQLSSLVLLSGPSVLRGAWRRSAWKDSGKT